MTLGSPIGSFVYLVFLLINRPAFAPVAGSENSDHVEPVRKTHRHHPASHIPEAEIPPLMDAVRLILGDDSLRIREGILRQRK